MTHALVCLYNIINAQAQTSSQTTFASRKRPINRIASKRSRFSLCRVKKLIREENPSIMHATWVGGEPIWRKELLRKAVELFPANWVVTNGTIPIDGEWKNTAFFISIDGTEEAHNDIRKPWKQGTKGLQALSTTGEMPVLYNVYQRAKKTAQTATAPVNVHTVINRRNIDTIPDLVAEWKADTPINGFVFSLHTPMVDKTRESGMSENDEKLFLLETFTPQRTS